jgi:tetratricopeptide (TPR) repeat protein
MPPWEDATMTTPDAPPADGAGAFDLTTFLAGLDAVFAAHDGPTTAETYLLDGLVAAEMTGDDGAQLSILNELLGLYRSTGRHDEGEVTAQTALALASHMGVAGSDAYATTLINVATAHRAAGRTEQARDAYAQALELSRTTMGATDRRLAALHNNLSMLHSDMGDTQRARAELVAALAILESSSLDPTADIDIATTLTNLSLVCHDLGEAQEAASHSERSLAIFRHGGHQNDAHYAAAVAGHAEASFRMGRVSEAVTLYRQALGIVAECYGEASDAYTITAENLAEAERALSHEPAPSSGALTHPPTPSSSSSGALTRPGSTPPVRGLALARAYWEEHGKPMLAERYPKYRGRIAAGLVGHGSECYGFDDALSRDHDFGPGFCLWLTAEDYAVIGAPLQADYDALPRAFRGVGPREATPRASGKGRRVGVFEIGDFYTRLTGSPDAPAADRPHEWLMIDEQTLAAATNGAVFADPCGAFSAVREGYRRMPDDVRLALIGRRLGMMAQAGQYNVPRMLERDDAEAASLAVGEFVGAAASAVFLLNRPTSVGYLPYYKWQFAALRALARRPLSRLPDVHGDLSEALRLASAACFGGAGFGEGGKGSAPAREALEAAIERACARVVAELRAQGLSDSTEPFLERQRAAVQARIGDAWLRTL